MSWVSTLVRGPSTHGPTAQACNALYQCFFVGALSACSDACAGAAPNLRMRARFHVPRHMRPRGHALLGRALPVRGAAVRCPLLYFFFSLTPCSLLARTVMRHSGTASLGV